MSLEMPRKTQQKTGVFSVCDPVSFCTNTSENIREPQQRVLYSFNSEEIISLVLNRLGTFRVAEVRFQSDSDKKTKNQEPRANSGRSLNLFAGDEEELAFQPEERDTPKGIHSLFSRPVSKNIKGTCRFSVYCFHELFSLLDRLRITELQM